VNVFVGLNVQNAGGGSGYAVVKLVAQNVPVADVSKSGTGGVGASSSNNTNVSLRVTDSQAAEIAYGSDNGKIWLALRPPTGATKTNPGLVNAATILLGVPPVTLPSYGGRLNRAIRHSIEQALAAQGGGR
jgi:Flp pilus assembly protein CpaB